MLCTHTCPARGLALGLAATLALTSPVVLAAPAKSDQPAAGDENLPDVREPGTMGSKPGIPPPMVTPATPSSATPTKRVNKGSLEQGLELSDQADRKFDEGDYAEAARLYNKTLNLLSENDSNHITRSIVVANGVTAYEHLYATTGDVDQLKKAQLMLQDYLRACKTKHGVGCDAFPETQEARARLKNVLATIDRAAPIRPRIPPEIDTAPGGKSYDLTVDLPPPPAWIGPAFVGGVLLAAGGTVLVVHGATAEAYGPLVERALEEGDTATDDTGTDDTGTDTSSTTSSVTAVELTPATKGKLLIATGAFLAAAGVGVIILSAMALGKHRRINKARAQRLAVVPAVGRGHAGFVLTGRF